MGSTSMSCLGETLDPRAPTPPLPPSALPDDASRPRWEPDPFGIPVRTGPRLEERDWGICSEQSGCERKGRKDGGLFFPAQQGSVSVGERHASSSPSSHAFNALPPPLIGPSCTPQLGEWSKPGRRADCWHLRCSAGIEGTRPVLQAQVLSIDSVCLGKLHCRHLFGRACQRSSKHGIVIHPILLS